jgi:hypothetical protein
MQTEPRKRDLPRILVEGNAPTQRRPIVPVHGCGGEMFPAPIEVPNCRILWRWAMLVSLGIKRRRQTKGLTSQSITRS